MPKLDFSLQFETVKAQEGAYSVIIVAAGSSRRMGGEDKLMMSILGMPVLARTLRTFNNSALIKDITVVTREEKIDDIWLIAKKYSIAKLKSVVAGGACREESVRNGVALYKGKAEKVLVHDGARPLVSNDVIKNVCDALKNNDSVTCGVRLKDTVKRVSDDGFAVETLNRDSLFAIQTPQGINVERFLRAAADTDLSVFTDDTSVMESVGIRTAIAEGDYRNIKITTKEDIAAAEAYLSEEL